MEKTYPIITTETLVGMPFHIIAAFRSESGDLFTQEDITSVTWTVSRFSKSTGATTIIPGWENVTIPVEEVILNTPVENNDLEGGVANFHFLPPHVNFPLNTRYATYYLDFRVTCADGTLTGFQIKVNVK